MMLNKVKFIQNMDEMREMIRCSLGGQALLWFNSNIFEIANYKQFESKFLGYFWGENSQSLVREKLYFGKFEYNRSSNLNYYALKLFTLAKFLDPPMREEEIIMSIARHFKSEVAETISLQNINTFDQFSNYLLRMERGLGNNRNRNTNTNTYDKIYNNGRFQNNRNYNINYNQENNRNGNSNRFNNVDRNNRFDNNYNNNQYNDNNINRYNNNNNYNNRYNNNNNYNNNRYNNNNNNNRAFNNTRSNDNQNRQENRNENRRRINFQQTDRRQRSLDREPSQEQEENRETIRRTTSLDRVTYTNDNQNF